MPNSIKFGRAGTDSSLQRTTNLPSTAAFTVMAWVRHRVITGGGYSMYFCLGGATTSDNYMFGALAGINRFGCVVNGTERSGSSNLSNDRWYHVALTVNGTSGTNLFAYLDGVLDFSALAATVTTSKLWVGDGPGSDWLDGNMSAIKIFDRPLAIEEINAEIAYEMPVIRGGLNTATPVPNGWDIAASGLVIPKSATTRWLDVSGNGNQWTEVGAIDTDSGPPIQFAPTISNRARYFADAASFVPPDDDRAFVPAYDDDWLVSAYR